MPAECGGLIGPGPFQSLRYTFGHRFVPWRRLGQLQRHLVLGFILLICTIWKVDSKVPWAMLRDRDAEIPGTEELGKDLAKQPYMVRLNLQTICCAGIKGGEW